MRHFPLRPFRSCSAAGLKRAFSVHAGSPVSPDNPGIYGGFHAQPPRGRLTVPSCRGAASALFPRSGSSAGSASTTDINRLWNAHDLVQREFGISRNRPSWRRAALDTAS